MENLIPMIKSLAIKHGFELDEEDQSEGYLMVSHRISPDMEPDYKLAGQFVKSIRENFPDASYDVEYVDEWSIVTIRVL